MADVLGRDTERLQLGDAAFGELVGQRRIEARAHDADAQIGSVDGGWLAFVGILHGRGSRKTNQVLEATKPVTFRP